MADRYIKQAIVGKGSFGAVYRGIDIQTNAVVAIKVINLDEAEEVCNSLICIQSRVIEFYF